MIAIVGPGGAGKTTWIKEKFPNKKVVHAVPLTRHWSQYHTPLVEVLMGIERVLQSYKAKIIDDCIMDRCFIDGTVYGRYWHSFWITKWFNKIIYKPDVIYFLSPKDVKAKREFEKDDFRKLKDEYWRALAENGYVITGNGLYDFGVVFKCQRRK